jgi:GNAT superfamily N-acetyltransferase
VIEIFDLSYNSDWVKIVANWAYQEWHKKNRIAYRIVEHDYALRAQSLVLPKCFVAVKNQVPVGMVSVKKKDLQTKKAFSPWLSALFVMEKYREQGIGTALINYSVQFVQKRGFSSIYLFTEYDKTKELVEYYQKRGWVSVCRSKDFGGNNVTVMKLNIKCR